MVSNPKPEVLIVQTAFLGDVLLGIPLLKTLRLKYPDARLTLLCRRGVGKFFIDARLVEAVIEVDKKDSVSWKFAREAVSSIVYDLLICPHESFRTALFVSRVRARRKIGFARWFNFFFFNDRVARPPDLPEALRQLALLTPIDPSYATLLEEFRHEQAGQGGQASDGDLVPVPMGTDMKVPALMELRNTKRVGGSAQATSSRRVHVNTIVEPFFEADERVVVLAPGSVWATKMWTKEGFIETGRALSSRGAIVVVMGSKEESRLCAEIARAIPNATSLAGRTSLYESAELLAVADLLICNDSGAMHLGAAAGVAMVSVFGPTVLKFGYRPWSSKAKVVQTDLVCRPCGKHGSQECPLGHHHCMKYVSPEAVLMAANDLVTPI